MDITETIELRAITVNDLDAITEIDYGFIGRRRRGFWEGRLESTRTSSIPSLVAVIGGNVIGFILGGVSGWEYGIPENIGWIDTLGVSKDFQKKGIGRLLVEMMLALFKEVGMDTVYIFVNWKDRDLMQFFNRMGFESGDMINLKRKI